MLIPLLDKKIFRIMKLPYELRLMIYEFAMVSPSPLHHHHYEGKETSPTLAFGLMLVCKQMLEETRPVFYKNSFQIEACEKTPQAHLMTIRDTLREVTWTWRGFNRRDANAIKFFSSCPNLKILNLIVTDWSVHPNTHHYHGHRHTHVQSVKKFNRCRGFDEIVGLKGFEKVRVEKAARSLHLADADIEALRVFLNTHLTKAKYVPPPVSLFKAFAEVLIQAYLLFFRRS